ncbi:YuzB family protein [Paenibacillus koleovorans]|uniref:YuzB family protein n=1 Tax=Paenibacillus koleovorans TaxID=121608 RepID=UPI000FD90842|nr:YuzB family protein [Paenibacillus koleovorans]
MRPIVEFCASNMHNGSDAVMRRLEEDPSMDVIEYGCLGNCGQCYMEPYALVNGEIVGASDADELYALIMAKIKQLESAFDFLDKME